MSRRGSAVNSGVTTDPQPPVLRVAVQGGLQAQGDRRRLRDAVAGRLGVPASEVEFLVSRQGSMRTARLRLPGVSVAQAIAFAAELQGGTAALCSDFTVDSASVEPMPPVGATARADGLSGGMAHLNGSKGTVLGYDSQRAGGVVMLFDSGLKAKLLCTNLRWKCVHPAPEEGEDPELAALGDSKPSVGTSMAVSQASVASAVAANLTHPVVVSRAPSQRSACPSAGQDFIRESVEAALRAAARPSPPRAAPSGVSATPRTPVQQQQQPREQEEGGQQGTEQQQQEQGGDGSSMLIDTAEFSRVLAASLADAEYVQEVGETASDLGLYDHPALERASLLPSPQRKHVDPAPPPPSAWSRCSLVAAGVVAAAAGAAVLAAALVGPVDWAAVSRLCMVLGICAAACGGLLAVAAVLALAVAAVAPRAPAALRALVVAACLLSLAAAGLSVVCTIVAMGHWDSELGSQWRGSVASSPGDVCTAESRHQCSGWGECCDPGAAGCHASDGTKPPAPPPAPASPAPFTCGICTEPPCCNPNSIPQERCPYHHVACCDCGTNECQCPTGPVPTPLPTPLPPSPAPAPGAAFTAECPIGSCPEQRSHETCGDKLKNGFIWQAAALLGACVSAAALAGVLAAAAAAASAARVAEAAECASEAPFLLPQPSVFQSRAPSHAASWGLPPRQPTHHAVHDPPHTPTAYGLPPTPSSAVGALRMGSFVPRPPTALSAQFAGRETPAGADGGATARHDSPSIRVAVTASPGL